MREQALGDDELAMMFMCCHPSLPHAGRIALTLKTVGGFGVAEIAAAFLAEPDAIAQRLVRAKRQIREQEIAIEIPRPDELGARLESVLDVLYLLFNEGYAAHGEAAGDKPLQLRSENIFPAAPAIVVGALDTRHLVASNRQDVTHLSLSAA